MKRCLRVAATLVAVVLVTSGCGVAEQASSEESLIATTQQAVTTYGVYYVRAKSSQKCISVSGPSTADNTDLVQYSCFNGNNQQWQLFSAGNGYYQLRVPNFSGKCMAVSNSTRTAPGYANNDPLVQYTCATLDNFLFSLVDTGDGHYYIKAKHTGKCVSVSGPSTADNQLMVQFDCFNGDNQKFFFKPEHKCVMFKGVGSQGRAIGYQQCGFYGQWVPSTYYGYYHPWVDGTTITWSWPAVYPDPVVYTTSESYRSFYFSRVPNEQMYGSCSGCVN